MVKVGMAKIAAVFYVEGEECEPIEMPEPSPTTLLSQSMVSYRSCHLKLRSGSYSACDVAVWVERKMTKEEEARYGAGESKD